MRSDLRPARVRRELAHAAEEVAVLAEVQRQAVGLRHGLDRLQHPPVAGRRQHQAGGAQALDVGVQLRRPGCRGCRDRPAACSAGAGRRRAGACAKWRIAARNIAVRGLLDHTCVDSSATSAIQTASCAASKPSNAAASRSSWSPSTRTRWRSSATAHPWRAGRRRSSTSPRPRCCAQRRRQVIGRPQAAQGLLGRAALLPRNPGVGGVIGNARALWQGSGWTAEQTPCACLMQDRRQAACSRFAPPSSCRGPTQAGSNSCRCRARRSDRLQSVGARAVGEPGRECFPAAWCVHRRDMPDLALDALGIGVHQHVTAPVEIDVLHVRRSGAQCAGRRNGLRGIRYGSGRCDCGCNELDADDTLARRRIVSSAIPWVEGQVVAPRRVDVAGHHDIVIDVVIDEMAEQPLREGA